VHCFLEGFEGSATFLLIIATCRKGNRLRVFENMKLSRIFGPKRDEVRVEWRKRHNEELKDLYVSPDIVRVIKSRRMRLAGHVACMGTVEVYTGFWWENMRATDHFEDPCVGGRIILRWIFRKWNLGVSAGSIWLRMETGGRQF
jgi:hypothetical protein